MKTFISMLGLSLILLLSINTMALEKESTISTQTETINTLIKELRFLKMKKSFNKSMKDDCNDDDDSDNSNYRCVSNCTVRYSTGSCASYGADFCGEDAVCVSNCTVRYSTGACASYGSDICY